MVFKRYWLVCSSKGVLIMNFMVKTLLTALVVVFMAVSCSTNTTTPTASAPQEAVSTPEPAINPGTKAENDLAHVKNVVNTYSVKLQNIYKRQSSIQAMYGSLNVKLFINDLGEVQNADIVVDTGNLSDEFLETVRKEALSWRFLIRDKMIYSFELQFKKM